MNAEELHHLGKVVREAAEEGEHPTGLAAIRLLMLTGFRRMKALALERRWFSPKEHCIRFPDTKGGAQLRVIGRAATSCIEVQPSLGESPFVSPADRGDGHFVGIVRVLDRICAKAEFNDVTAHVLRHTFASVAGDLGFSELTIAGLLGHSARGVTQGYVHWTQLWSWPQIRLRPRLSGCSTGRKPSAVSELRVRSGRVLGWPFSGVIQFRAVQPLLRDLLGESPAAAPWLGASRTLHADFSAPIAKIALAVGLANLSHLTH